MLRIDCLLGNTHADVQLRERCDRLSAEGKLETLSVEPREAGKGRLRKATNMGTDVGIVLERGTTLADGDVLYLEDSERAIIVEVQPEEVLAITLDASLPPDDLMAVAVELGHVLGNQHWPVRVEGATVYVPVTIDPKVMEAVLKTYHLDHLRYEFKRMKLGGSPPTADGAHAHKEP